MFFDPDPLDGIDRDPMLLSIIIPAWQEAKRLPTTIAGVERLRAGAETGGADAIAVRLLFSRNFLF